METLRRLFGADGGNDAATIFRRREGRTKMRTKQPQNVTILTILKAIAKLYKDSEEVRFVWTWFLSTLRYQRFGMSR